MNGGTSDTAATAGDPKFPPSGEQTYRVSMAEAPVMFVDVDASTGDGAAELALRQYPNAKVVTVNPAPQKRPTLSAKAA